VTHPFPDTFDLDAAGLQPIGPIVRLQVQRASLKRGEPPHRAYDPSPLVAVTALRLDPGGVSGVDANGDPVPDIHHRDAAGSRHRSTNGVSLGFTSHYDLLRQRHGNHLPNGIAGENILVEATARLHPEDLAPGIVILSAAGPVRLTDVHAATPCVEFSKYCAGHAPEQRPDRFITETLRFLDDGIRGFYATLAADAAPVTVAPGDLVCCRIAPA
jgi:hypothetical protein